jgi:hypothetical protein
MQVSFLLGESIVALLADKLDKAGHDVERVVDMDELGEGSATPRPDAARLTFRTLGRVLRDGTFSVRSFSQF